MNYRIVLYFRYKHKHFKEFIIISPAVEMHFWLAGSYLHKYLFNCTFSQNKHFV